MQDVWGPQQSRGGRDRRPATGRVRGSSGLVGAVLVLGVLSLVVPGTLVPGVLAQYAVAALCGAAAWACLRAARRRSGRWRRGWRLLAAAAVSWAAGNTVTGVSLTLLPGIGLDNLIYPLQGLAMVAVLAGLLTMPRPAWQPGVALRTGLDVWLVASCLLLLGAVHVAPAAAMDTAGADLAFALAYPGCALLMLAAAHELGRRHVGGDHPELAWLTGAFAALLVAAAGYARFSPDARYAPLPIAWAFGLGALLLMVAASRATGAPDRHGAAVATLPVESRVLLALPEALAVASAITVVVMPPDQWYAWLLAGTAALGLIARHSVIVADARAHQGELEGEVADRTARLSAVSTRYATILDTVRDGIVGTDVEGRITFANAGAARLLHVSQDLLVGVPACEALCATPGHDGCAVHEAATQRRVVEAATAEFRRHSGGVVPVEFDAAPVTDGGPRSGAGREGAVLVFRDVSERHAVEQLKRQFISSVSHELRTPLSSVRGALEMLADGDAGELSPMGRSLAANASRGVDRLGRLVDDIIDAEKLAAGEFDVQPRVVDLARLVGQAVAALEPLGAAADVRIVLGRLEATRAWCDADRVEQAVVNLVGNAVKFSGPGDVVRVETEHRGEDVLVSVVDQGPGIPPEERERVFDRFHQVAGSAVSDRGGTGLGLTITRSIVERHGGDVWVESEVGAGSTFRFVLPHHGRLAATVPPVASTQGHAGTRDSEPAR